MTPGGPWAVPGVSLGGLEASLGIAVSATGCCVMYTILFAGISVVCSEVTREDRALPAVLGRDPAE